MNAPVLDTLRTAQTLKTAGFPPEQAEATAQVLGDALADVATKADLDSLEARVDAKLDSMEQKFETKFEAMDQKLEAMEQKFETKFDGMQRQFDGVQNQFDGVQKQFDGVQRQLDGLQNQLETLTDHFKLHARVSYAILGIIVTLLLGSLVAPYLSWSDPAAATPTESPAATAEEHSAEPQAAPELPPNI